MTRTADIVVAAVGRPDTVTRDMVRPGVVVIDVGSNRIDDPADERGYKWVGDVDFDGVSEVAAAITPVPGGVGPMTITMLLKNTLEAARRQVGAASAGGRGPGERIRSTCSPPRRRSARRGSGRSGPGRRAMRECRAGPRRLQRQQPEPAGPGAPRPVAAPALGGGEVANWTRSARGHCYFSLRDADAQVRCVLFASDARRLPTEPEEGMRVRVLRDGHSLRGPRRVPAHRAGGGGHRTRAASGGWRSRSCGSSWSGRGCSRPSGSGRSPGAPPAWAS
jgi:hypothetical protein